MEKKTWKIKIWLMLAGICLGCLCSASGVRADVAGQTALKMARGIQDGNGFWINANGMLVAYTGAGGDVVIPSDVTYIGEGAFENCGSLTGVTIPSSVTHIGEGAFENCGSLTSVTIPSSVTHIGDGAFEECGSLTSITIPSGVTYIGEGAFENCISLKKIKLPSDMLHIGDSMFENCYSLSSITIPSGVMSIGEDAFAGCRSLTSVTIPSGVTSIGEEAFFRCSGLRSVTIPSSVSRIGESAFAFCDRRLVIYCARNSSAERYAEIYGIDYQYKTASKPASQKTKKQTITAQNITKSYGSKSFLLGAKTNGGGRLTYSVSNKKVAAISKTGRVTIKGCGVTKIKIRAAAKDNYASATKSVTLTVEPKKQKISSLKSRRANTLMVKWREDPKVTGYIVQYSTDKSFRKDVDTVTVDDEDDTAANLTDLDGGRRYYVRICAYKISNGELIQGDYGPKKSMTVKR